MANAHNSGTSGTSTKQYTRHLIDEIEDEDVQYENEEEIVFAENKHLDPDSDDDFDYLHNEEDFDAQI